MRRAAARLARFAALLAAALAAALAAGCGGPPPLNVLLITLDTTRHDALGAYGQPRPITPELDRLAAAGVVFEQVYSASPSTLPSHATLMTGRMPFAHGARANGGFRLAPSNRTLAEVFAEHGYRTAAEIAAPVIGARTGLDQGFEHYRDLDAFDVVRKRVRVAEPGGSPLEGLAEGVDDDGALRLRLADGRVERVLAGDVTLLAREGSR